MTSTWNDTPFVKLLCLDHAIASLNAFVASAHNPIPPDEQRLVLQALLITDKEPLYHCVVPCSHKMTIMGISAHLWFSLAPLRLRLTIYPAHRISAGPTSSTQKPQSDLNTRVQQTTILPATMQRIARFFSRKKPDHQSTEVLFDHDQTLHAQENSTPPVKPSSDLSQETLYNEGSLMLRRKTWR